MKNKYKPFFYENKKTSFRKIFLIVLICVAVFLFYGFQIPSIRQVIAEPLYAAWSFTFNSLRDFLNATRMYHEQPAPVQTYTPLEFPDRDVLFAESLESLSGITQEDPLADLRQTPTPSAYARVAEWEYLDPNLNYSVNTSETESKVDDTIRLIPPVFEHADLFNDGAAILSADLRYWGEVENQYQIAEYIHPDSGDPVIHFSDLEKYIQDKYPGYTAFSRINGNKETLIALLQKEVPVILGIRSRFPYQFWIHDDRVFCRYILIHGYDSSSDSFIYSDSSKSNTESITTDELMAEWYPFQRRFLMVYPNDRDENIREALSENYFEELNFQQAGAKFRTDSELLTDNPFSLYNYGVILYKAGDYNGSLDYFRTALELSLPQRYISYQTEILDTLVRLGYADELSELVNDLLIKNSHDDTLTVYSGWASVLRGDIKEGSRLFEKAGKINPQNETVRYALKYVETMIQ